jgi:hypothetical protein
MALKNVFPVLFGIVYAKNAFVAAHVKFFGVAIQWNMTFVRAAHD